MKCFKRTQKKAPQALVKSYERPIPGHDLWLVDQDALTFQETRIMLDEENIKK